MTSIIEAYWKAYNESNFILRKEYNMKIRLEFICPNCEKELYYNLCGWNEGTQTLTIGYDISSCKDFYCPHCNITWGLSDIDYFDTNEL